MLTAANEAPEAVFIGTYPRLIDPRGRVFLPAQHRRELAEGVVMTRGPEGCLYVFTTAGFRFTAYRYSVLGTSREVRAYSRILFAGAVGVIPDRYGRIRIPQPLRDHASLGRDCIVIGSGRWLEIWDGADWRARLANQVADL